LFDSRESDFTWGETMSQYGHWGRFAFVLVLVAAICTVSGQGQVATSSEATGGQLEAHPSTAAPQPVIVLLKHQPTVEKKGSNEDFQRAAGLVAEQQPLLDEIRGANATKIKSYRLVNAFAATIPQAEIEKLKVNPAVARVIPDGVIKRKKRHINMSKPSTTAAKTTDTTRVRPMQLTTVNTIPGACGASGAVLLAPEGIILTNTDSQVAGAQTARSLGMTGAGVKVAWIADGVDPSNVNFIRAQDGLTVFDPSIGGDYQDFSGDGPYATTDGGEAFLDSNSIAGQGVQVYDVSTYGAEPNASPCNVTIEGVAPGAALVGLKVFTDPNDNFFFTTNSAFFQAIDYAVETDHVDVLNESYGANNYPDEALDAMRQFDEAAVAAGVVVVVGTGDAGPANTFESPASDRLVISAGATTQFQMYVQSNWSGSAYFATTGWLSNNISALSSGGFDQAGGTIDLVAPGDLSWASCDASSTYGGCINALFQPSAFEQAGGTSESSPFVAGAAALVIQAYRQTHNGASPTPALVKQILISSASDLGGVAVEQGAGLLNTYQAVLLAESVSTSNGTPTPVGNTLLLSTNQLNYVAPPNTTKNSYVKVTNTGATRQTITLSGRTLGPDQNVQTGTVTLNDSTSPQFVDFSNNTNNYATFQFTVPAGANRLDASMAYPFGGSAATLILIDPQGRFAANSLPQGGGGYGNVDVISPTAGQWTGVVFDLLAVNNGVNGTIPWQVATEQFTPFATIHPASFTLTPGQTKTVTISATTPSTAGDMDGSIVLSSNLGETNSIPVTLRSVINPATGGAFSGTFTGGNGRFPGEGQIQYYQFNVGSGVANIAATVTAANDPSYNLALYLISPDGNALGYAENQGYNSMTGYTVNPSVGTWTLVVENASTDGTEVSQPFTGNIVLNNSNITVNASGLPNSSSTQLPAGVPLTIPVTVTNNGAGPGNFFIDARLNTILPQALANQCGFCTPTAFNVDRFIVPTETETLTVTQTAAVATMFDMYPFAGDPLLASASFGASSLCSTTPSVSYSPKGKKVTAGGWYVEPTTCGPYTGTGSLTIVNLSVVATAKAFDPTVNSSTGDYWLQAFNPFTNVFTPLVLGPGQSGTINVTITPAGPPHFVVKGTLYLSDSFQSIPPPGETQSSADEVVALPYEYTIP
jgi:hypothetical protein